MQGLADSLDVVVNPCPASGASGTGGAGAGGGAGGMAGGVGGSAPTCADLATGQVDSRALACGKLDDLAVAFEGLHPHDVTLTRLEANLPRAALAVDLVLKAADIQSDVSNRFNVVDSTNAPECPSAGPPVLGGDSSRKGPWNRDSWALFASILAALFATFGRRATRPLISARAP